MRTAVPSPTRSSSSLHFCILLFSIFFLFNVSIQAQKSVPKFVGKQLSSENIELSTFHDFDLFKLDVKEIYDFTESEDFKYELHLRLGQKYDWEIDLYPNDNILADDYQAFTFDEQGNRIELARPDITSFYGFVKETNTRVRITMTDDFLMGFIEDGGTRYYIEPLAYSMGAEELSDEYVVYEPSSVKSNEMARCGMTSERGAYSNISGGGAVNRLATDTGETPCRKMEIATAADFAFSDVGGTNAIIAGILNMCEASYQGMFQYDIDFCIVEQFIATTAGDDPGAWETGNDAIMVRDAFCNWANTGGFAATFDLGQFWTGRTTMTAGGMAGVVGVATGIGDLCNNQTVPNAGESCNVVSLAAGTANATLVQTSSHEIGHNFGCWHNDEPGNNMMEPFVNPASTDFSTVGVLYGNETLLSTATCMSTCFCVEVVQAVPVNCNCNQENNQGDDTYDLQLTVEHDNTAGSFTAAAGAASMSFAYGANPQTVTLAGVSVGTTSITVTDDGDASCTYTIDVLIPNPQSNLPTLTTNYCVDDNNDYDLTSTPEEFGQLKLTVNSDAYAGSEQAASITDRTGNVLFIYPIGTFANAGTTSVTTDPINLACAPFDVTLGDTYGDGLSANDCFGAPEINGSYSICDGGGNVIVATQQLDEINCGGNQAILETNTVTTGNIITTTTFEGAWTGTGVSDPTALDGNAIFNPMTAGCGQHDIEFDFTSYKIRTDAPIGCFKQCLRVNVFEPPVITQNALGCSGDELYDATFNVNLGCFSGLADPFNFNVVASAGTASAAMINTNGTITVTDIPEGTNVTLTVGGNTPCPSILMLTSPTQCVPVELISFTGKHIDGANYLNWETASELNNDHFQIERSLDGKTFAPIGKVAGNGTTVVPQRYEFVDMLPFSGANYYRLKQVDFDGTFDYSDIVIIDIATKDKLEAQAYPSPAKEELNILSNQIITELEIIDIVGKTVASYTGNASNAQRIAVQQFATGTYFIVLKTERTSKILRFVKE